MSTLEIAVSKRSTCIITETYMLEVDEEAYNAFKKKNPNADTEQVVAEVESTRTDYEVEVEDTVMVHDVEYELEDK